MEIGVYVDEEEKQMGKKEKTIYKSKVYVPEKVIGHGSFGVVYKAMDKDKKESVAIKKTFHDPKYKNREIEIMRELDHPNIVRYHTFFVTEGDSESEKYDNIVMDYLPEDLQKVINYYK